ncbi:MAG: hypothetical protein HDR71_10520 [Lachnospiraceae bacterium]|nr:hypothetical protein [Lachnospiraceae bacterium]
MTAKEDWFDFELNRFTFEGREAIIVEPKQADERKNYLVENYGLFS